MRSKEQDQIWKVYNEGVLEGKPAKEPDWETDWDPMNLAEISQEEQQRELQMGIEVEMEHTNDPKIAREIALDHLDENPTYYSDLKQCAMKTGKTL